MSETLKIIKDKQHEIDNHKSAHKKHSHEISSDDEFLFQWRRKSEMEFPPSHIERQDRKGH
jgi:hypothetical protein